MAPTPMEVAVFPELVHTADNQEQTKSVNYLGFVAWMIEAIKELAFTNQAQDEKDSEIQAQLNEMMAKNRELEQHLNFKERQIQSLHERLERIERVLDSD